MTINPHPGLFIAFEGIDGSGKSVQADFIAKSLADVYKIGSGHILKIHEPTTGHFGRAIKRMLTHKDKIPDNPLWFQELFVQDRKDNLARNVIPYLREKGNIVLSDRYVLSTFAYGMAQGLKYEDVERLHKEILGDDFIYPDITF
ncbi:MAG TPA: dTMP kinase, partial [Patescibacteria group bacterium]|nr:dTMP kinase [Patescibacteria group bacterium]